MDFGNAALLITAVFGLTEFGKRFLGMKLSADPRITALLALTVGQGAVWLVGTTAWAHEQVIGTKPLDELNTGSKVLVGLFVAGAAAFGAQAFTAVRNIGQNEPLPLAQVLKQVDAHPDVHETAAPLPTPDFTFGDDA